MALAQGDRAEGDAREAFGVFYVRHAPVLKIMIRSGKLGSLVDWDEGQKDALHQTFRRAFRFASTFQIERLRDNDEETAARMVRSWLGKIACNVIADIHRAQGLEEPLSDDVGATPPTPFDEVALTEPSPLDKAMATELEKLSEKEQEVIAIDLEHKSGMGNEHLPAGVAQALANRWGTTTAYVRKVRYRAHEKLRERLAHHFQSKG